MIPSLLELERVLSLACFVAGVDAQTVTTRHKLDVAMRQWFVGHVMPDMALDLLDRIADDEQCRVEMTYYEYDVLLTVLSYMTQHVN